MLKDFFRPLFDGGGNITWCISESVLIAWAHPVIADGKLYLRDQDKMLVYNLK